jgi:hypothetical protein
MKRTPSRRPAACRPAYLPRLEALEERCLLTGDFRTIDGSGNNLQHPDWGKAGVDLLRIAPPAYGDGFATPAGRNRPSARVVSNTVSVQLPTTPANDRMMSAFAYTFGQFIDHDLDLTPADPQQPYPIPVPCGDPFFDPNNTCTQTIGFDRSVYDPATGTGPGNPRQQPNEITAWLDGSMIYGSDPVRAAALRTFSGGRLKTSPGDLLPLNTLGLPNDNQGPFPDDQLFLAGDTRANENAELTALQTIFMREHNYWADHIAAQNPGLDDETIYQLARQIVGAELQAITYNEFLPTLLGPGALTPYAGYKPDVNAGIATEFSTVGYRVGHTMLGDDVQFLNNAGRPVAPSMNLDMTFFNPSIIKQYGVDPLLKYLATDNANEIDTQLVDSVRNFLFGPPGAGGFDLASLNVQRGRDHGIPDYNSLRVAYGLPPVFGWSQITSDHDLQSKLQSLYNYNINNVDGWVGALAEDHVAGGSVGPLIQRILADQFQRLRDGDRFWYQLIFPPQDLQWLEQTTLGDVVRRNSGVTNLQPEVLTFDVTISGRVFDDVNGNQVWDPGEPWLAGWTVRLLKSDGTIFAQTLTDAQGFYEFDNHVSKGEGGSGSDDGLGIGKYNVRLVKLRNWVQTTKDPDVIDITKGMTVSGVDFGCAPVSPRPPAPPIPAKAVGQPWTAATGSSGAASAPSTSPPSTLLATSPAPAPRPVSALKAPARARPHGTGLETLSVWTGGVVSEPPGPAAGLP